MNRREFVRLIGAAVALPLVAHAQQQKLPVVGFLSSRWFFDSKHLVTAWQKGLREGGFTEGRHVLVRYRWAEGNHDRLRSYAKELVAEGVNTIVAVGGNLAALAAQDATSAIPIVFVIGSDAVKEGLVSSLNHPGGNITGVSLITSELGSKRLELLRELTTPRVVAVLINPRNPDAPGRLSELERAAGNSGDNIAIFEASTRSELEDSYAALVSRGANALLVLPDPFFNTQRQLLISLAIQHRLSTVYDSRDFVVEGG